MIPGAWAVEINRGSRRNPRWRWVFTALGGERGGCDAASRYFMGQPTRWRPVGQDHPCSYMPHGRLDPGEVERDRGD